MQNELVEIDGIKFKMHSLNMKKSIALHKQQKKMKFFDFVEAFIETTTTLDEDQIKNLKFQVAIAIMVYHRFYFWENIEVVSNPKLTPIDFLGVEAYEEKFVTIDNYRYSNIATLKQMQNAEKLCYLKGESEYLNFYLMGAMCKKGLKQGINTILNDIEHNEENMTLLKLLNFNIGKISNVKIDFLQSSDKIGIFSKTNNIVYINDSVFFWVFQK